MTGQIQGFRLSPQQRRLWTLQQEGGTLRAQCALRLPGRLDAGRLRQALQGVVDRHDVLRTTFHRTPGIRLPVQAVAERGMFSLETADLTGVVRDGVEQEVARRLDQEAGRHDLENGPVLRCVLAALPGGENALLVSLSPVCADAWSLRNAAAEILRGYAGSPDLPEADGDSEVVQYLQFSEWLHELLESPEAAVGREHWRRRESLRLPAPALPFERESGPVAGSPSTEVRRPLGDLSWSRLAAAADSLGASPEAFLLAAWQTLLARLAGVSEVVVGAVVDGRKYEELQGALGPFSRALPVAARMAGEPSFAALLEAVRGELADGVDVQEYCDWQEGWEAAGGNGSGAVGFELAALPAAGEPGASLLSFRCELDRFKLKLTCRREGETLAVEVRGATGLFVAGDLARLAERFAALLASAVERPRASLGDLEVLSAAERRQLLVDWNATCVPLPAGATLASLFAAQARRTPEAVALEQGGRQVTFAELDARANRLANHLLASGAVPDVLVAVLLERSPDLVVALLATLKAGAAYLPLDPGHPDERLRAILEEARPFALVTREGLAGRLAGASPEVICLDAARAALDACDAADPGAAVAAVTGDHLAYVLYTSGSTGRPKGVMVTQRGLLNYVLWAAKTYPVSWGEGSPVHSPIVFDLTVTSLFLPLLAGRRAVLVPEEEGIEGLCSLVRDRGGFGLLKLTPAHLQVLTQWLQPEQAPGRAGALVLGGEALLAESLFFWRARAPETRLFNEYGPTEAVVGCVVYEVRPGVSLSGPVPIGRPIDNTRCYVLDAALRPVPCGLLGELYLAGAGLARGYLGRPDLTAERFVPDPFGGAGERLYRTGDLVRWTEGELVFAGRTDQQVKVHGYRIELGEVEAVLAALPGVREAAVVVREDTPGDRRLAAYYVPEEPEPVEAELRAGLEARLPAYMIPAALVSLPDLPLTTHGKVDRAALPAPGTERPDLVQVYVAPENEIEEILAAVVGQVLRLDAVGVLDNFFALGGDSIRSVQIVAHARDRGLEFNVEDLFRHQTIRALAAGVGATAAAAEVPRTAPFDLVSPADRRRLPAEVEDAYPLTLLQSGMLFHMGLTAERPAFHNVNTWHIRAPLDPPRLQAAVDLAVARHPVLRTSFDLTSYGEPLQLVHRAAALPVVLSDLRHLPAEEQAAVLREFWERENRLAFDLSRAPLIRYHVHRRSEDTFQFTLTELHVILDGWSTTSTLAEIFQTYFALVRGEPLPEEPPLSLTFRDFVAAERRELAAEENRRFWEEKLRGSAPTRMPRRPAGHRQLQEGRVEKLICPLPGEVFEGLRRLSRQEAVPLKSVLLSAHLKALSVLSGERDVVTALASNGRLDVPEGTLVRGLFLNMLPLRIELRGGSWADLARQAFDGERELLPYRRYPLAAIQKAWGGHDLSETLFNYLNFHSVDDVLRLGDGGILDDDEIDFSYTNFTFDACFLWIPLSLRMLLLLEYDPAELDRDQVQLYQGHYLRILETMAADPQAPYDALCLLSAAERDQVLTAWNRTATAYPAHLPVHRIFMAVAARMPDAEALAFDDRRLSYGELDRLSNQLAHHLRALGVGREDRVGVCLDRCWEMVVGLLAILKAGGAYVPLDPAYPRDRLAYMIEDAGVGVLLTRGELAAGLSAGAVVRLDADAPAVAARSAAPLDLPADPDGLAYVIYTSGSTGRPKGVAVPHRGVVRLVLETGYVRFLPDDRVGHASNVSFDAATFEIWGALLNGCCLVGIPRQVALDPRALADRIREDGLTVLFLTPALFNEVAAQRPQAFASTRYTVVGGDALDTRWARQVLAQGAPQVALVNGYGPTEGTTFSVCHAVLGVPEDALSIPIGRPIANSRAYILDTSLQPVPAGSPGELYLGGDGLARAYLKRPGLTAERFVPDPCSGESGGRLYRSGDLARFLPDGTIEFLGRRDQQVKLRGFRVEPGEVEAALRRLPAVREAAVVVRGSGPGDKRLVAYVVGSGGAVLDVAELRQALLRELPEYMIPAAFVELAALPITPNGKVDRGALPELEAVAAPSAEAWMPPRTPTEEVLAAIWAQVLGVERVGANDSFFNLGGDSILGIRTLALARERGLPLSLEQLFSQSTLAQTARLVEEAAAPEDLPETTPFSLVDAGILEGLPPGLEDAYPVTRLQLGMLYHLRLEPNSPAYHNVNSWHLRAPFDPVRFQLAVDRAVARHPALRAGFDLAGFREPLQLVHARGFLAVGFGDLRGLPEAEQTAELRELLRREHSRLFDLACPPLVRLHVHRRTDDSFQFTLTECHAVTDGWSTTSTLAEIFRDYLVLLDGGEPAEEPAPATSFRDFVLLERRAMESEEQRTFWERWLAGAEPVGLPQWPAAAAPGAAGELRAHKLAAEAPPEVLDGLWRLARAEAVPLKSVLLAAHAQVLGALFGSDDVLTGLTSNGRLEGRGGDRVRGLFLNTLPLRLRTDGCSGRELARRAFRAEQACLPYRRYPLAAIQKSWGRQALLEANFNYVNFHSVGEVLRSDHLEILDGGDMDLAFANFPLGVTFAVSPLTRRLRIELELDAARAQAPQAAAIRERYLRALRRLAEDPDGPTDAAALLSPAEAHQLLVEWNDSAVAVPDLCVHELFAEQAARTPDAVAAELGDRSLTFAELEARSNQLAGWLQSRGAGAEAVVVLAFERSPELLVAMLGVLKAGAAFLPLDPSYPKERLAYMLADARPAMLLTHRAVDAALPPGDVPRLLVDADWQTVADHPAEVPPWAAHPEDVAYLIYTSGSTGRPKGVAAVHRGLANFSLAVARRIGLAPGDRFLQFASLSFDASLVAIFPCLLTGATLVLHPNPTALSVSELMALCVERRVSLIDLPGALWRQAMREMPADPEARPGFRVYMTGGESLSSQAVSEWAAAAAPDALLISSYGPTETTVTTTMVGVTSREAAAAPPLDASLGALLANVRVYLLDRHLRPVPVGTPGELHIGGAGLTRGYLRRPELTAAAFGPDPFGGEGGGRLYRTGDLVRRLPDGGLQFLGRADGQVKIRGFRVELGEIEAALSRHPGVCEAVASLWTSPGGEKRLVAYVVPVEGGAITITQLKAHLRTALPESMIPSSFVVLDALPVDPNGKVDRRSLPAPGTERPELAEDFVAPRSELERTLAGVWQEVLELERVGVKDNFFDLGGDSLSLLRAHGQLQKVLGREIPLVELFEFPTVSALAEHLRGGAGTETQAEEAALQNLEMVKDRRRRQLELSQKMAEFGVEAD